MAQLTSSDEGKKVINQNGETIGMVSKVSGGTAHVDPDPGVTDKVKSMLGWDDAEEGDYALSNHQIDRVTDDEIHVRQ
ncbi:PRC-barrel domain containing protein [Natronocalculus amylovorans]|uniref:PRC-barrel domain containing protein n=1 Tax=Natronocalculus amylovorans TaxID=2917812 RepID=A0AAE3G186_9EURY|nr:PRC-barrel domain containing protein [Natronocalculus amylovorans]MCL9818508.1 PRC-barrel domain containing protein [Natronocalculus amylovorans]